VFEIIFANIFSDMIIFHKKLVKPCLIVGKNDVLNVVSFPSVLQLFPRKIIDPTGLAGMFLGEKDIPTKCVSEIYRAGGVPR
jgi:hypothetical protein